MLLTFTVKNFKGFKNKQSFNLVATSANEYKENLFEIDVNHKVNKNACIIGANSSGKTHLLNAIETFADAIKSVENVKEAHQPFSLDIKSSKEATEFEALLFDDERKEYINYSFSVLSGKIISESLFVKSKRKNAQIKLIFKRSDGNIEFSRDYKQLEELLKSTVDDGGLISNYAPSLKNDAIKFVGKWASSVFLFNPRRFNATATTLAEAIIKSIDENNEGKGKGKGKSKSEEEILNKRDVMANSLMSNVMSSIKNLDLPIEQVNCKREEDGTPYLMVVPKTVKGGSVELTMPESRMFFSEGTYATLNIAIIIELFSYAKTTLLIDEFDGALHHKLSLGVLDLIRRKDKSFNSQMIMSTHDILLIDKGFRRDSIFVLKKDDGLSTEISRISDYSVRKDAKLSLKYLSEEFGALPNIMSDENNE